MSDIISRLTAEVDSYQHRDNPRLRALLKQALDELDRARAASADMDAAVEAAQAGWLLGEELGEDDIDKLWYAAVKAATRHLHDESLRKGFERYEYVRTLAPIHFIALWEKSIRGEGRFDDLVDVAIRAEKEASSRE